MMAEKKGKLIHLARISDPKQGVIYVLLRESDPGRFVWFKEYPAGQESETSIFASIPQEAIRQARTTWTSQFFDTVKCGFRYLLPERDEHGYNALFHQMVASYSAINGVYFDEEFGCNCIVHFASAEARSLWRRLQSNGQL
jgi:hypothetical protein